MARSLSQTLVRIAPLSRSKASPPIRLINVRNRSNQSAKFNNMETVEFNSDGGETERIAVQKLEDAIHKLIVRRSQPDWLPFLPGASYWVPPKSKARGFAEVINKLASSSNKEGLMSLSNNRGWPSSEYFLKGASPSPIEVRTNKKKKFPSEDEEG